MQAAINRQESLIANPQTKPVRPDLPSRPAASKKSENFLVKFGKDWSVPKRYSGFAAIRNLNDPLPVLEITGNSGKKTKATVLIKLPIEKFEGKNICLSVFIKAEKVEKPPKHWQGIRVGLMITGNGKTSFPFTRIGGGSFQWQKVELRHFVPWGSSSVSAMLDSLP